MGQRPADDKRHPGYTAIESVLPMFATHKAVGADSEGGTMPNRQCQSDEQSKRA